jgi:hypothetical protein
MALLLAGHSGPLQPTIQCWPITAPVLRRMTSKPPFGLETNNNLYGHAFRRPKARRQTKTAIYRALGGSEMKRRQSRKFVTPDNTLRKLTLRLEPRAARRHRKRRYSSQRLFGWTLCLRKWESCLFLLRRRAGLEFASPYLASPGSHHKR